MPATNALQIAASQLEYLFTQLSSALQSVRPIPWLLLIAALVVLASIVQRLGRGAMRTVICPRDRRAARVELAVVDESPPDVVDCSLWPCPDGCEMTCVEHLGR